MHDLDKLTPFIPWALTVWGVNGLLDFIARFVNRRISREVIDLQRSLIDRQKEQIDLLVRLECGR